MHDDVWPEENERRYTRQCDTASNIIGALLFTGPKSQPVTEKRRTRRIQGDPLTLIALFLCLNYA